MFNDNLLYSIKVYELGKDINILVRIYSACK